MHWGVDSVTSATRKILVPTEYRRTGDRADGRMTLFDYVKRRMGEQAPSFWGRYLNMDPDRAQDRLERGRSTSQLTRDEADFLHDMDCKILPVYNGSHRRTGGYNAGLAAAAHAVTIARDLRIPTGTTIYADLENWQVPPNWFRGWIDGMRDSFFGAGAYGKPIVVVENPESSHRRYGMRIGGFSPHTRSIATRRLNELRQRGEEPRRVTTSEVWGDDLREALSSYREEMTTRVGRHTFEALYARDFHLWSNMPRRVLRTREQDAAINETDIPTEFVPAGPADAADAHLAVWQYLQSALWPRAHSRRTGRGLVDMNLADNLGFSGMWG